METTKNDEKEEEKDTTKRSMLIVILFIVIGIVIAAAIAWAFQGHFLPTFEDFDVWSVAQRGRGGGGEGYYEELHVDCQLGLDVSWSLPPSPGIAITTKSIMPVPTIEFAQEFDDQLASGRSCWMRWVLWISYRF
jgi:hypothetical protein